MHRRAHPKHSHVCAEKGLPGAAVTLCSTPDEAECHLASGGAKFEVLLSEVRPLALVMACVALLWGRLESALLSEHSRGWSCGVAGPV